MSCQGYYGGDCQWEVSYYRMPIGTSAQKIIKIMIRTSIELSLLLTIFFCVDIFNSVNLINKAK